MPWGKMDDKFHRNRKVRELRKKPGGREALGCWVFWWSWCLDDPELSGIVPNGELSRADEKSAKLLVAAGLWDKVSDGHRFHDFNEYNPTRDKVERKREADRKRQARRREDESNRESHPESQHVSRRDIGASRGGFPRDVAPTRVPVPSRPVPTPSLGIGVDPTLTRSSPPAGPETPPRREPGRSVGVRPELTRELLPAQLDATEWEPDPEFAVYASELGIEFLEFESIIIELKDQNRRRPHDAGWWELTLCKFLESRQRARSERLAKGGDVESLEDGARRVARLKAEEARG